MHKFDCVLFLLPIIRLPEPICGFPFSSSSSTAFSRQPSRLSFALQTTETPLSSTPILFEDLQWKLELPENAKWVERVQYTAQRWWEAIIIPRNDDPSALQTSNRLVHPRNSGNSQLILEGYLPTRQIDSKKKKKKNPVIRMGFTTQAGPPLPLHPTTLEQLKLVSTTNNINDDDTLIRTMALIFLWIDPQYRGLQWGIQAMRIVRYIHFTLGADCTVIVANDKGSGRLVPWYEQQGFVQALELQECLGSPNQIYGTAMVGRTLADDELAKSLVIEYAC